MLVVQIHTEDERGYINGHMEFRFDYAPSDPHSKPVHDNIAAYIREAIILKKNNKVIVKKFHR